MGAAIWIIGMDNLEQDGKIEYESPRATAAVERFVVCTHSQFECSEIVGRRFRSVAGVLSVVFTAPIREGQDYLVALPAHGRSLIVGALLVVTMGLVLTMVAVAVFPILKERHETLAVGYVVFRAD